MVVEAQAMRETLRLWPSGVSVVTSAYGSERTGMTVSAFNSLSLEPPLIIVCLKKDTSVVEMIEDSDIFGVSILGEDQADISNRFAGFIPLAEGENRFDGVDTMTAKTGAPLLVDCIAWLDCRVREKLEAGTHYVVIGEVVATGQNGDDPAPLIYFNRGYRELHLPAEVSQEQD